MIMNKHDREYFGCCAFVAAAIAEAAAQTADFLSVYDPKVTAKHIDGMRTLQRKIAETCHAAGERLAAAFVPPAEPAVMLDMLRRLRDAGDAVVRSAENFAVCNIRAVSARDILSARSAAGVCGKLKSAMEALPAFAKPGRLAPLIEDVYASAAESRACCVRALSELYMAGGANLPAGERILSGFIAVSAACSAAAEAAENFIFGNI